MKSSIQISKKEYLIRKHIRKFDLLVQLITAN